MIPNHCSNCAARYSEEQREAGFPTTCQHCQHTIWDNPIPVAVCVQPVKAESGKLGLAVAKRAIEPRLGTWNLLAGHMDNGETVEQCALREFGEETSIRPGRLIGITGSYANGRGHVLIAVEFEPIALALWKEAKLCPENSEFGVMWSIAGFHPLGFPIHRWIAERWFELNAYRND